MAETVNQPKRAVSVVAFGVALACTTCAFVLPRMPAAEAQESSAASPARVQIAQAPGADAPAPAGPAPTDRTPIEPSRPNPFHPVAGEREYNIRGFPGPTYPGLPMTMTVGFPPIERPMGGLGVGLDAPLAPDLYMRCSAIIWNKSGMVVAAMQVEDEMGQIQPYTVHPGDLVGSYIVEEITQNTVTLRDRDTDRRRTVRLESARSAPAAGGAAAQPARPAGPLAAPRGGGRAPVGLPAPPPA
jgi:hypothetical protein